MGSKTGCINVAGFVLVPTRVWLRDRLTGVELFCEFLNCGDQRLRALVVV